MIGRRIAVGAVLVACSVLTAVAVSPRAARAQDSDALRGYLHLKFRDTNNLTGVHDYYGFSLGANLNRYFGFEVSGDRFELFPDVAGLGSFGEYGVFAIVPQARLRYPLLHDRLVPYVIGGVGVALTDFNDRKPNGFGVEVRDESSTLVGTLGAGLDYFIADNIALNAEFKYLFAESQTLRVGGVPHRMDISTPLTSVGFRLFFPELRSSSSDALPEPAPLRVYFDGRLGLGLPLETDLGSDIVIKPVPAAIGGELAQYFGVAFGLDIGRYWGAEFGAEGYEVALAVRGVGTITEWAFYGFIPRARFRYPMGGGRWIPYASAGVGIGHVESNDRKPPGADFNVSASGNAVAASVGVGLDYFVARNIAVGLESKYLYSPSHEVTIAPGHSTDATVQTFITSFGLRVYFWDIGR
jgi:opacity protein-like surface antigen